MFLHPRLKVMLRLTQVEAFAVRHLARNFVHAPGSLACEAVAAVCTFPNDFELTGAEVACDWFSSCVGRFG